MRIETERLILREPKMSDWKDLVEGLNNLNMSKNLTPIPYPYTKKLAIDYLKKCTGDKSKNKDYKFYIELKNEKKVIGAIDLLHVNKFQGTAETGSWINEKYQKKGYITEAKIAANEFAFNILKLRKLFSPVFTTNEASNATQKRMGYKLEGTLKKHSKCLATGEIHDNNMYGLLKEDWKKVLPKIKKHLKEKIEKLKKLENKE
jgi:[ribosomal protein S5]-alanine N-acetyltransferase